MSNLNLQQFIQAQAPVKLHIARQDLSSPNAAVAHADLAFLMDGNNSANAITTGIHAVFLELQDRVPYDFDVELDLVAISSTDSAIVRQEINKYLQTVQISFVQSMFAESDLSDDEVDYVEGMYPDLLDQIATIENFAATPFKAVEAVDNTSITATGFINEVMYAFTDKIVAETLYGLVKQYFNPNAKFEDFIEHASELIKVKL